MGAAEAAKHITRKQLDNLIALQQEFLSYTASDPKRASYLNRKFHFGILEASNKPILRNGGIVLGHHRPHPEGLPRQDGRHRLHAG